MLNALSEKILHKFEDMKKTVVSYSNGFPWSSKGVKIMLEERIKQENYCDCLDRLTDMFGSPLFVHGCYGYIWKAGEAVVTFGVLSEGFDQEAMEIFLFEKMPRGEKLTFDQYEQADQTLRDVFEEYDLRCDRFLRYVNKEFFYLLCNGRTLCMLTVREKSLRLDLSKIASSETGMRQTVPDSRIKRKVGYSDLPQVQAILEKALSQQAATP